MKVKEAIGILQKFSPELDLKIFDEYAVIHCSNFNFNEYNEFDGNFVEIVFDSEDSE